MNIKLFLFSGCIVLLQHCLSAQCNLLLTVPKDTFKVNSSVVLTYAVDIQGGTPPYTYLWSPTSAVTCYACHVATSTLNKDFESVKVKITDAAGCMAEATQYVICNNCEPCGLSASVSNPKIVINKGESPPELKAAYQNNKGSVTFEWNPHHLVSCSSCATTKITSSESTNYYVLIKDKKGCYDTSQVFFQVLNPVLPDCQPKLYVPNIFSPNNDGINDYFTLFSNHCVKEIKHLQIFNRWGALVFERKDFPPNDEALGWNGRNESNISSQNTFIYIIDYQENNGKISTISGNITIQRE